LVQRAAKRRELDAGLLRRVADAAALQAATLADDLDAAGAPHFLSHQAACHLIFALRAWELYGHNQNRSN
jgi:hypothetical protein